MKATIEVPDELYRQVKAKSALEGRTLRDVATELFRRYVDRRQPAPETQPVHPDAQELPAWFGRVGRTAPLRQKDHDLEAIRLSIARGISQERLE